jgi:hypothetical protein
MPVSGAMGSFPKDWRHSRESFKAKTPSPPEDASLFRWASSRVAGTFELFLDQRRQIKSIRLDRRPATVLSMEYFYSDSPLFSGSHDHKIGYILYFPRIDVGGADYFRYASPHSPGALARCPRMAFPSRESLHPSKRCCRLNARYARYAARKATKKQRRQGC